MYLSRPTITALVAALPAAIGFPTLSPRQNGVTCQTSDASPVTGDITDVINQLRGGGGSCPQTNGEASGRSSGLLDCRRKDGNKG